MCTRPSLISARVDTRSSLPDHVHPLLLPDGCWACGCGCKSGYESAIRRYRQCLGMISCRTTSPDYRPSTARLHSVDWGCGCSGRAAVVVYVQRALSKTIRYQCHHARMASIDERELHCLLDESRYF